MKRILLYAFCLWAGVASAVTLDEARQRYQAGDKSAAFAMFMELAKQGDAKAQGAVAMMYMIGDGVPRDRAEALAWLKKCAAQGNADAEYQLARIYLNDNGDPSKRSRARELLASAAAQGHELARQMLESGAAGPAPTPAAGSGH